MKTFITIVSILFSINSLACTSDIECGIGNVCVKAQGSYSINGICAHPTDEYGNSQPITPDSSDGPHEVNSCEFNTDCDVGYSCMKQAGQIDGICMK
jgi:hypothetical protein